MNHSNLSRISAAAVGVSLVWSSAAADLLRVPEQFGTIQEAIDASADGDDILVAPGIYRESINLNRRAIRIRGQEGPGSTVIDGDGTAGYVVRFPAGTRGATLQNLTVTGAAGQIGEAIDYGGAILVDRAFEILLRDVAVSGNVGQYGAALFCKGGSTVVENCDFFGNTAAYGGAVAVQLGAVSARWSRIEANASFSSGGGVWVSGGQISFEDCVLNGNSTSGTGAGIAAWQSAVNLSRCVVEANGDVPECPSDCLFDTLNGGGVYLNAVTSGRMVDCRITANAANAGGGLYFTNGSAIQLVNTAIVDNVAGTAGAAAFVETSSPDFANCTMLGNLPGGVFTTNGSSPEIVNCVLSENNAQPFADTEVYGTGESHVSYSLINGNVINGAILGEGVIFASPRLDGALRPKPGSPVIDSGNNSATPADIESDLAGMNRFIDDPDSSDVGSGGAPIVDMGAMEFSIGTLCAADFDGDGFVTGEDHTRFVAAFERGSERADFDGDGFVNGADFDAFSWAFLEGC